MLQISKDKKETVQYGLCTQIYQTTGILMTFHNRKTRHLSVTPIIFFQMGQFMGYWFALEIIGYWRY